MFEFPKGEQRLSFYRPSPPLPHRYISIFSFPFFFFPLPSLSRKRDKHERAGIDLFEALHEHQQRSRNKRVEDPPKRPPDTDSLFYRRVPRRTFLSFLIRDFFLKNRRYTWGGPGFRPCPRVILRTFRHTRYTDPFSYPSLFNTPFFPLSPFSSNNNSFSYYSFESATSNSRSFSRD